MYDEEGPASDPGLSAVQVRKARPEPDGTGVPARLDRLEKALHAQEQALGRLAEKLSPALTPEQPSAVDGMITDEPRSELAARLDRMCSAAESHLGFIRSLGHRIDL